ncbi:MAG: hypothetical protein DMG80_08715, partial [Acidobacteria bacterium]
LGRGLRYQCGTCQKEYEKREQSRAHSWPPLKKQSLKQTLFPWTRAALTKDARQFIRSYAFGKAEISQPLIQTEPS